MDTGEAEFIWENWVPVAEILDLDFATDTDTEHVLTVAAVAILARALTGGYWKSIIDKMDFDAVLIEAGLRNEYNRYVHAQADYDY